MRIQITNKDIYEGKPRSCTNCAAARAINRVLPQNMMADVLAYSGWMGEEIGVYIYPTNHGERKDSNQLECPDQLTEFARDFDEWAEWQYMDVEEKAERRESEGMDEDEEPERPCPITFELPIEKILEAS